MSDLDDLASQLEQVAERLAEAALERLYELSRAAHLEVPDRPGPDVAELRDRRSGADPRVVAEERRITRARRAVEKAVHLLRSDLDGDETT